MADDQRPDRDDPPTATNAPGAAGTTRRSFVHRSAAVSLGAPLLPMGANAAAPAVPQPARVRTYRTLGKTGLKIADISFGSSRLRIGEEAVVQHALDAGVNYFDTAESYTDGDSEIVLGNALKGKRDQVILASKQFSGRNSTQGQMMKDLEGSLRRLQTDHIEIYFNHAVNDVARMQNDDWYEFIAKAKAQGKIQFTGISGHAGRLVENLDYVIDNKLVDVVLVGYNFGQDPKFYESITRSFDFVATQPDLPRVLDKAHAAGIGVIAMKTLMGARLNDLRQLEEAGNSFSQAAFRWTLSNPAVDALIVSMTNATQIDEYLGASGATALAANDLNLLREYAVRNGASYCKHACDSCNSACPYGVDIAEVLRTRMYAVDYQDLDFARREYAALPANASPCLSCNGEPCQSACPHGLAVDLLCAPTHRMLA
jgi:predicted aldo/keto reductase-like oxidoreductase